MSFDDIFALLLFIVFIGLPLLNRMQQRGRPGAPPPGQGRPGAPGRPPGAGGQAGRPAGGAAAAGEAAARQRQSGEAGETSETTSRPRVDDDPFAELAKRLEEARRRVRDASGGGASASSTGPAARTIATPAPPSMSIPDPRAGAAPRAPTPRDPFPKGRARPAAPWQQRSASRPSLRDDAPALEVERVRPVSGGSERRTREISRMQARDLVALDAQSFRKGIMWHMVLSGPVAYRGRRKPSRPASR